MNRRLRAITVASTVALATTPGVAHANDMSGIAVVLGAIIVGGPAAVLLVISIVVSSIALSRPAVAWHRRYAVTMLFAAPFLGFLFPLAVVLFDGRTKLLGGAIFFDLPVLALAAVALVLAVLVGRRPC